MIIRRIRLAFRLDAVGHQGVAVIQYVLSTGALVTGLGSQLIAFIILARYLGTSQLGQWMTILAATTLAGQICGIGAGEAMIRRVGRKPSLYPVLLGHAIILTVASGIPLAVLTVVGLTFFVSITNTFIEDIAILFIFAISNIILYQWITLTESIFLAKRLLMRANLVNMGFAVWRALATIIACVALGMHQLEAWALCYGLIHLVGALACVAAVWRFGPPRWRILRNEIGLGIHYTTPAFLDTLRQNVDLLALNGVGTPATIGQYSAASRIVLTSLVTINSFYRIIYPHLSVAGKAGTSATFRLALRYVVFAVVLAAITSTALFVAAPYLALLFGKEFGDMVFYLRVLCWIPILVAIKNAAYDALGAAERHAVRAAVYNSCVVASAVLIVGMTRLYGLEGLFAALYISHGLVALAVWVTLFLLSRREKKLDLDASPLKTSSEPVRLL
jgi:O-antigen/teichoic acid export membrane protein